MGRRSYSLQERDMPLEFDWQRKSTTALAPTVRKAAPRRQYGRRDEDVSNPK